jgi:hypothetical protein
MVAQLKEQKAELPVPGVPGSAYTNSGIHGKVYYFASSIVSG